MIRLRIAEILEEQGKTKYWLFHALQIQRQGGISYQNLNKMINNETSRVYLDKLDDLCKVLECNIGDLFEQTPD
ncbi:MAG: helix-turn-helix transcriptional regulator [Lachnospiraceae bacterium]|nr:helix-turn-helix transcriptional regulator [Lachnospiraceae bacterium]